MSNENWSQWQLHSFNYFFSGSKYGYGKTLTENGYYMMYCPFWSISGYQESSVAETTAVNNFTVNKSTTIREDKNTPTELNGNKATITPIGIFEGAITEYSVVFHSSDKDYKYAGTYSFKNTNKAVTENCQFILGENLLGLYDGEAPAQTKTDANGSEYNFVGWTTTENSADGLVSDYQVAAGAIDLYPYYELKKAKVSFYEEDGVTLINSYDVTPGEAAPEVSAPAKDADDTNTYSFDKWVALDGSSVDLTNITASVSVKATYKSTERIFVSFYEENGETLIKTVEVKSGEAAPEVSAPAKDADDTNTYSFDKWVALDGSSVDLTNVTASVSVKATYAAKAIPTYTDVSDSKWYSEAVKFVSKNGIMDGLGDGTFSPNTTTNRAMFMTVLYRVQGKPDVTALDDVNFPDYDAKRYYADAAKWAVANGIVKGTDQGNLEPTRTITREELVTMLYRFAENVYSVDGETKGIDVSVDDSVTLDKFTDVANIHNYAKDAVKWAVANGYVNGYTDGTFLPRNSATRAEMAKIITAFVKD
jgi:hypothetical protein